MQTGSLLNKYENAISRPPEGLRRLDASYPRNIGHAIGVYARLKNASEAKKLIKWLNGNDMTHQYHCEVDHTPAAQGWTRVIQSRSDGELLRADNLTTAITRPPTALLAESLTQRPNDLVPRTKSTKTRALGLGW